MSKLLRETALTRGQVVGCIQRLEVGEYVTRQRDTKLASGRGSTYTVTTRGEAWLVEALELGKISESDLRADQYAVSEMDERR